MEPGESLLGSVLKLRCGFLGEGAIGQFFFDQLFTREQLEVDVGFR